MARAQLWLKLTAVIALVAVLGAGAALVAVKSFLPEAKLRAMVVEAARKQLGREVRLAGVSIGLTGAHLRGLEISERPDFAAGTFLSVEVFSLRPSWKALLRRKLVVATASADGLKVRVIKGSSGAFNYETLASSAAAGAPVAKTVDTPPAEFNVRHLRVHHGAVDYRDDAMKTTWAVTDLALTIDDFSLSEPFDLELSLRAKGKAGERPIDAALAFTGTVNPARGDHVKFSAELQRLSLEQDGLKLSAKGRVNGLDAISAKLDATLSASGKTLCEADGTVKLSAPGESGSRVVDADLKIKTSGLDTTLMVKWFPAAGVPALSIPAANAALVGRWNEDSAALKSFSVSWKGGKIEGEGTAGGLGGKSPTFAGRAAFGLDLPEIRAGEYSFIKLPSKTAIPAMRLDGEASYDGSDLKISSLTTKFKQGTVSVSGAVRRLGSAKPAPDLALRLAIDLPAIKAADMPMTLPPAVPAGFVLPAMRLDGGARLRGDDVIFEKISIKGKSGNLHLDGAVLKALSGTPVPEIEIQANLDLPALTDKDLPFPGVPAGLELPPSRWDADLTYTTKAIRLRKLAVKIASNELSIEGGVSDPAGRAAFDLLLKCKRFVLDELTRLTPKTRDLKLAGSGFFALSVTGSKVKPVFGGKLQFMGLGATVAELPLSGFTGTVSFDERRVDLPNLKGKVADGSLTMDLTIKDYAKNPEIQVEASLDRFDLGRYLTAKKKMEQDAQAAKAAKGAPAVAKPAEPFRTRGKVEIGALVHPNAQVENVSASWDLYGVTPDMKKLSGDAKIGVGGGTLHAVGDMALQSPVVKVLIFPILIVQKLSLGVNLNNITVRKIVGDYLFKDGLMTLRKSEMDSNAAQVSAVGTIDLPAEILDLVVTAQVGSIAPIDVAVTGTVANPKSKVKLGKLLGDSVKGLLNSLAPR